LHRGKAQRNCSIEKELADVSSKYRQNGDASTHVVVIGRVIEWWGGSPLDFLPRSRGQETGAEDSPEQRYDLYKIKDRAKIPLEKVCNPKR